MKRALLVFALAMMGAACKEPKAPDGSITGEGIVHRGVGPECPDTWHVATADGRMLWPVENAALQVEGLRVRFTAREKKDAMSTCMAGTIVEFVSLEKH